MWCLQSRHEVTVRAGGLNYNYCDMKHYFLPKLSAKLQLLNQTVLEWLWVYAVPVVLTTVTYGCLMTSLLGVIRLLGKIPCSQAKQPDHHTSQQLASLLGNTVFGWKRTHTLVPLWLLTWRYTFTRVRHSKTKTQLDSSEQMLLKIDKLTSSFSKTFQYMHACTFICV